MTADQKRVAVIASALLAAITAFLLFQPARQQVLPKPRCAHVAVEMKGDPLARVGERIDLPSGTRFTLRAVLEAEDWRGRPVYYTEADRLSIDGVEVAAESLRRWEDDFLAAKVLWLSVEGANRYREVASPEDLSAVTFREVFRPDWPQAWSIPGSVRPSFAETDFRVTGVPWPEVGTLRYQVRVELFGPQSQLVPRERYSSPGGGRLPGDAEGYPTVTMAAPGQLAIPSRRLGLPQVEPLPGAGDEVRERLRDWTEREIAFSRLDLLRLHVKATGERWDQLSWEEVELDGSADWGAPGDLIQAGSRVVVAFEDRGEAGRLDGEDLALDYDRGGSVVRLATIFPGEGLVERAMLSPAP